MIHVIPRDILAILAKKGRIELIRTLKAYPEKDFTINELARLARVPVMTAWRGVKDLRKAGIVKGRRIGNAISVSITDDRELLKMLKLIPETDPQRSAAIDFSRRIGESGWVDECKLFGTVGKGIHAPGEEVDVAVFYDEGAVTEEQARSSVESLASEIRKETNVSVVPLLIARKDRSRRGGLAGELSDKETIWARKSDR